MQFCNQTIGCVLRWTGDPSVALSAPLIYITRSIHILYLFCVFVHFCVFVFVFVYMYVWYGQVICLSPPLPFLYIYDYQPFISLDFLDNTTDHCEGHFYAALIKRISSFFCHPVLCRQCSTQTVHLLHSSCQIDLFKY